MDDLIQEDYVTNGIEDSMRLNPERPTPPFILELLNAKCRELKAAGRTIVNIQRAYDFNEYRLYGFFIYSMKA